MQFRFLCLPLILTLLAGCASKKQDGTAPVAVMPADNSVVQVSPSPKDQPVSQEVLPSRDDSVAALIRKSEEYAREMNQPVMSQQVVVKEPPPQQPLQNQQTQPVASNETKTIDISNQPTLREPPAEPGNAPPPAPKNVNASLAETPQVARVTAQLPAPQVSSSDLLEKRMLTRVKEYPRDVAGHLEYQLMQFVKDQPTPDLATLSSLPEEDRELVAAVMDGLSNFRNQLRTDNNMLLSKKIRPMVDLAARLQSQAELTLPTLTLCTRVDGFGRYEPIEPLRFVAGKDNDAIVYCEVANFTTRITGEKNLWQTDLSQDIVLYSEAGQPVWTDPTSQVRDTARVRRHDFFVVKRVKLPASLPVGRYLFKVTITDRQSNYVAESSLPVQIVAQ
jgi:hypothetical protein